MEVVKRREQEWRDIEFEIGNLEVEKDDEDID